VTFPVILDANVLYPATLRNLLLTLTETGLVRARWTNRILDEVFRNIRVNLPDLPAHRLDRTRALMETAIRDCLVTGHEQLETVITLPDPDDRHVVAAAIRSHASVIVTMNLKDFPEESLAPWGIEARHPDDFLIDQFHLDPIGVHKVVQRITDEARNPAMTVDDVLDTLERTGMVSFAALMRR
jgi:predicted nucleic acid-binding protein